YKAFLEESIGTLIKEYTDNSTDTDVDITVKLLQPMDEKLLKLTKTLSSSNMNLFNKKECLHKYDTVHNILDEFYEVRMDTYHKRKEYQIGALKKVLHKLTQRVTYIRAILTDQLDLRKKTQVQIVDALKKLGIEEHEGYNYLIKMSMDSVSSEKVLELEQEHEVAIRRFWDAFYDNLPGRFKVNLPMHRNIEAKIPIEFLKRYASRLGVK
ncbi:MAG: hypothetical protein EBY14_12955, partial [Betaproteobacteria bacterium]|nr:hypothetical protein [Betaproteobacteria bacterium]